jgi:hypothetical protein
MADEGSKLDLARADKPYYTASKHPKLVAITKLKYIAIADRGSPDSTALAQDIEALYQVAYRVKALHKAAGQDFAVAKLEGLWWVEGEREAQEVPREEWRRKLLVRMPDFVNAISIDNARRQALADNRQLTAIRRTAFDALEEGMAVQMLHVGPYDSEPETLRVLRAFMAGQGLRQDGLHHEIYLSDPRKTEPSAMKTIVRLPVRSIDAPRFLSAAYEYLSDE